MSLAGAIKSYGSVKRKNLGKVAQGKYYQSIASGVGEMLEDVISAASKIGEGATENIEGWEDYESGVKEVGGEIDEPATGFKRWLTKPKTEYATADKTYTATELMQMGSIVGDPISKLLLEDRRLADMYGSNLSYPVVDVEAETEAVKGAPAEGKGKEELLANVPMLPPGELRMAIENDLPGAMSERFLPPHKYGSYPPGTGVDDALPMYTAPTVNARDGRDEKLDNWDTVVPRRKRNTVENKIVDRVVESDKNLFVDDDDFYKGVIEREGGLGNNPNDKGGLTKFGISQKHNPDIDVANLTREDALKYYKKEYPKTEKIWGGKAGSDKISKKMFDVSVGLGRSGSVRVMQDALTTLGFPTDVDGGWSRGGETDKNFKKALAAHGDKAIIQAIITAQKDYYAEILTKDPSQQEFEEGWLKRANYVPL